MTFKQWLKSKGACSTGIRYAGDRNLAEVWGTLDSPYYMCWILERTPNLDHMTVVRMACEIARTVLPLVAEGENRPRLAIEAAESWANNPCKETEDAAISAANSAAYADTQTSAANHYAAAADANAYASNAYAVAVFADAANARSNRNQSSCDIIRKHFPLPVIAEITE